VQVSISARHGHLSAATQEKITDKVDKLRRFFDRLTAIQITVDLQNRDALEVEVRASAEHKADFVASERAGELFSALDAVIHKLEQQLRRHKERIQTGHRQRGRKQFEAPLEPEEGAE
jgi:putative sigma-54 modulation protein